jgi:hypothetical protein
MSQKGCVPIRGEARDVTWDEGIFAVLYSGDPSQANPHTALSRCCPPHLRPLRETAQRSARLPPCPSGTRRRQRPAHPHRRRRAPVYVFCRAHRGPSLCPARPPGARGSPALRATAQSHRRVGKTPQAPGRSSPPGTRLPVFPREWSRPRDRLRPRDRRPAGPRECPWRVNNKTSAPPAPPAALIPTRLISPLALSHAPPWSPRHVRASALCSMQTKPSSGALLCPARAGGVKSSARACLHGRGVPVRANAKSRSNARHGDSIARGGA